MEQSESEKLLEAIQKMTTSLHGSIERIVQKQMTLERRFEKWIEVNDDGGGAERYIPDFRATQRSHEAMYDE